MKKSFRTLLAAAAVVGLASCATEEPDVPATAGTDSFSISIPTGVDSRVFSDGSTAKNIYVAVYPADKANANPYISNFVSAPSNSELISGEATVTNGKADLSITLVKGEAYNVFFWAESYTDKADNCPYTFNPTLRSITVNYGKMGCNSDAPDAFYYYGKITADGTNHEITLRRPFAQINIGTDDYNAAKLSGLEVTSSAVTFSSLATALNFGAGTVSGETKNVTLTSAAIPAETQSFPIGDANHSYSYLNMAYVLVNSPADGNAVIDNVSLRINEQTDAYASYPNIPVRANYRTNIYGSLLTDQTTYKVTLSEYEGDNNQQVESDPTFTEVSSWTAFKNAVDNGQNVRLTNDILDKWGEIEYTFQKPVIIDLNGKNIYDSKFTNAAGNTLTIQGKGTLTTEQYSFSITNRGTMIIKGENVKVLNGTIDNQSGATCTIDGGTFDVSNSRGMIPISNSGIMTIKGGTFKSNNTVNVDNKSQNSLMISGGTFTSTYSDPLNISANTEVTITGGNFIGKHAINLSGGTVNISGGFFYSDPSQYAYYATICNSDGKSNANITGGYFSNLNQTDEKRPKTWSLDGYQPKVVNHTETIAGKDYIFKYQVVSIN